MELYIDFCNRQRKEKVDDALRELVRRALTAAFEYEGVDGDAEVSVTFVSDAGIRKYNREYRGIDRVTDVLSFPQFADLAEEIPEVGEICLGDVVICKDKAEEQAQEFGHAFEREIIYLFVHSVLHLLGYDHEAEADKKIMRQREEEIMQYMEIPR